MQQETYNIYYELLDEFLDEPENYSNVLSKLLNSGLNICFHKGGIPVNFSTKDNLSPSYIEHKVGVKTTKVRQYKKNVGERLFETIPAFLSRITKWSYDNNVTCVTNYKGNEINIVPGAKPADVALQYLKINRDVIKSQRWPRRVEIREPSLSLELAAEVYSQAMEANRTTGHFPNIIGKLGKIEVPFTADLFDDLLKNNGGRDRNSENIDFFAGLAKKEIPKRLLEMENAFKRAGIKISREDSKGPTFGIGKFLKNALLVTTELDANNARNNNAPVVAGHRAITQ